MEVTATFLADYAKTDASNKVNAIGVFSYIEAEEFPALLPEFCWVLTLNAIRPEIEGKMLSINLSATGMAPEGEITVFQATHEIPVGDITGLGYFISSNMVFGFNTLALPSVGRYVFTASINDEARGQAVLYASTPAEVVGV